MKYLILISFLLTTVATNAQEVQWLSFEEAMAKQAEEPKKIIMDVYTNWCGPCKLLDKRTFQNKYVANYINEHYYAVKFNAEGNENISYKGQEFVNPNFKPEMTNRRNGVHQFTSTLGVQGYPTIVFFDEETNMIVPLTGFLTPQQIELYLKMMKTDAYKDIKTQEEFQKYQEAFVPEFEG